MDSLYVVSMNIGLLVGIWWLYFVGYRNYRLDKTRQNLFAIRDQLFREWADQGLPFDAEAYVIMRTTLNGMIRFAHRLSMIRFLGAAIASELYRDGPLARQYEEQMNKALDALSPEAQEIIKRLRREMHLTLIDHIVRLSLTLRGLLVIVAVFHITNAIKTKLLNRWSSSIDAEAKDIGRIQPHDCGTGGALPA